MDESLAFHTDFIDFFPHCRYAGEVYFWRTAYPDIHRFSATLNASDPAEEWINARACKG
jgi:hypothetical protein